MFRRNTLSWLALAAAGLYAVTGAIELAHDQPTVFADPIDYWLEGFFAAGLVASVAVLASIAHAALSGRPATIGWTVGAAGNGALLVAAVATVVNGRETLDPLFGLGFLAIAIGYITLTVIDLRKRLVPSRAGLALFVGFAATAVFDNLVAGAGGLVLAASWAAFARLISGPESTTAPSRGSALSAESAS